MQNRNFFIVTPMRKKLALKINIQRILIETLKNGDEVSYKINDSKA